MFLFGFLFFIVALVTFFVVLLRKAPLGYEDKSGFHYFHEETHKTINRKAA